MRSLVVATGSVLIVHAAFADATPERAQSIESGRRVYVAQCATCHGAHGEGQSGWQGLNADGEKPAPPHDRRGHTWKHSDAMLYRIIADGWRDPFNKTPRLTMPAFRQTLTPEQIRDVIAYLKTMWTPRQRAFQREESRDASFPATDERSTR